MATLTRSILVTLILMLAWPQPASAGMPSVTPADVTHAVRTVTKTGLNDIARQRLEVISFFLLGLLACAGVIRWLWNGLRKDFPILPRLSYARALGMLVLWGLLFVLVLTMISGARELMTPGAWEKKGLTYRLVPPSPQPPPVQAEIDEPLWQVPSPLGGRYVYVGGRISDWEAGRWPSPLAYEPEAVGPDRLVLMTDGNVQWMPASEIERALSSGEP
jgi:hypothetical protein